MGLFIQDPGFGFTYEKLTTLLCGKEDDEGDDDDEEQGDNGNEADLQGAPAELLG